MPLPGVRDKGAGPLLGARQAGEDGPFGQRADDGDDQDHDDEP